MTTPELSVEPTAEQVAFFRENGFLAVERLTTDEEIAWLGTVHDELFASRRGYFDVSRPFGDNRETRLGQIIFPERRVPELATGSYWRNARRFAAALLGCDAEALESWGHSLHKPARVGHATPWHQDEAYWEPGFAYQALGAWLPLEDVDGCNGCMCFLPGSHRSELLPHRHVGGDPSVHLLELAAELDTAAAVPVPLRAGGATFHAQRTLHATAPNTSDAPRRVFAFEFQLPPRPLAQPEPRPWHEEARRAWAERGRG